jgi:hypothetical protein
VCVFCIQYYARQLYSSIFLEVSCLRLLLCGLGVAGLTEDGPVRLILELNGTEDAEGEI